MKRYNTEEGQIYRKTDDEVNEAIDQYLEMQGYEVWNNLSDEDKQKIMETEWKLEQEYIENCRRGWYE